MGKNSVKKSLGKCIGNIALHKILLKHTNKPESRKHLSDEIDDYGSDAFEKAQLFNWNEKDKEEIKEISLKRIKKIIKRYPDQRYDEKESINFIDETIEDMLM